MTIEELRPGMHVTDYTGYEYVAAAVHPIEPDDPPDMGIQVNTLCGNVVFYPPGQGGFSLLGVEELPADWKNYAP